MSRFVAIEGLEGAGKTTVVSSVRSTLLKAGVAAEDIVLTREPGGTPMAEEIRALLLKPRDEQVTSLAEAYLFQAARAQHLHHLILPALSKGKWVICDRFLLSTYGYQLADESLTAHQLNDLSSAIIDQCIPDLTILLDVDPETGLQRARARGVLDRIESAGLEYFENVRRVLRDYLPKLSEENVVIDANQPAEQVSREVAWEVSSYYCRTIDLEAGGALEP